MSSDAPRLALGAQELALQRSGDAGWSVDKIVMVEGRRVRVNVTVRPVDDEPYDLCRVLGLAEEALVEALRSRPFVRVEVSKGGVGLGLVVQLEGGLRAVLKPQQVSPHSTPRHEVAAYLLARALDLDNVPPTILRTVTKAELLAHLPRELDFLEHRIAAEAIFEGGTSTASVMAWAPNTTVADVTSLDAFRQRSEWLSLEGALPAEVRGLAAELSTMIAFDVVINNGDRMTGGNVLASPDGLRTVWIDNGFAFGTSPRTRAASHFRRCQRFSRRFVAALRGLDAAAIARAFAGERPLLDAADIGATLERAALVVNRVDELIAAHGEPAVLAFA